MLKSCADEEVPSRFGLDLVSLLMNMTEMTQRLNLILQSIESIRLGIAGSRFWRLDGCACATTYLLQRYLIAFKVS